MSDKMYFVLNNSQYLFAHSSTWGKAMKTEKYFSFMNKR